MVKTGFIYSNFQKEIQENKQTFKNQNKFISKYVLKRYPFEGKTAPKN